MALVLSEEQSMLRDSARSKGGARARAWLRTKANSIEGGTSEVMLGIVAKRILDLPGA